MQFLIDHWDYSSDKPTRIEQLTSNIQANHWYHCHRDEVGLREWLESNDISDSVIDNLLAQDTRPMFEQYDDETFLLILRGVNLNQDANPEDMLSLRLLFCKGAVISTRKTPSKTVANIRQRLEQGNGPASLADLIAAVIEGLNRNIDNYLNSLEERISEFDGQTELSEEMMQTHKALLKIKRFIKPQQYAINDYSDSTNSMALQKEMSIRHSVNTITRINETLDFYLGELELIKGELRQYHAEKMNQNTYLFSVIAAIFLPTSFLTGLLGVNVGGIPGTENPIAFSLFCLALVVIFGAEFWILRRLRFFSN